MERWFSEAATEKLRRAATNRERDAGWSRAAISVLLEPSVVASTTRKRVASSGPKNPGPDDLRGLPPQSL